MDHGDVEDGDLAPSLPEATQSGVRIVSSAVLLIAGLGLLSLPAHHFIMDDLPAAAMAGIPALLSLWGSIRLTRPAPSGNKEKMAAGHP